MDAEINPSSLTRLPYTQIRSHRLRLLREQHNMCGLCGEYIEESEAVLDHNHNNGRIRKVLHRGCNALLGKIENNMKRNRVDLLRLELICSNLASYIGTDWTDVVHPKHKEKKKKNASS